MASVRGWLIPASALCASIAFCAPAENELRLITLDPGHFHAGLVQKFMYPGVDSVVRVYSPAGPDLQEHLKRIEGFNTRAEKPTHWKEEVYTGNDFLEKMARERKGNVVVLSGNNSRKTEYIDTAVKAGFNVYADKPMAITPAGFKLLRKAMDKAEEKGWLVYDIMTERFEMTSVLQRELAKMPEVFGTLQQGTPENPGVVMESVHYFSKEVAGKPLIRPAWFFDVRQQGEAVPDVGTHLVDLVQWESFPEQSVNWRKDIKILDARRWPARLTKAQFRKVTGLDDFPEFLRKDVSSDGALNVFQNGDVTYRIKGVYAKITALWDYAPPTGGKDTHYSLMRGSKADLEILHKADTKWIPALYVKPKAGSENPESVLRRAVQSLAQGWPGVDLRKTPTGWEITVPEKYNVGHEAHFAQVTENFLKYLKAKQLPAWETPNMLAKYYVTTEALRLALKNKSKIVP